MQVPGPGTDSEVGTAASMALLPQSPELKDLGGVSPQTGFQPHRDPPGLKETQVSLLLSPARASTGPTVVATTPGYVQAAMQ